MAEFNEALHPRAPKGTENGGEFIDKEESAIYSELTMQSQQKTALLLREKLLENGIFVSMPNTSITDYGVSTYLTYKDINGVEYKFRISDHSVQSNSRLKEYHYNENTNLNTLFDKFKSDVIGNAYYKNERDVLYNRQKKYNEKVENQFNVISHRFTGKSFNIYERTYMKPDEFYKKHPNASDVLIIKNGNAFRYEYAVPNKDAYIKNMKPSFLYKENINKIK